MPEGLLQHWMEVRGIFWPPTVHLLLRINVSYFAFYILSRHLSCRDVDCGKTYSEPDTAVEVASVEMSAAIASSGALSGDPANGSSMKGSSISFRTSSMSASGEAASGPSASVSVANSSTGGSGSKIDSIVEANSSNDPVGVELSVDDVSASLLLSDSKSEALSEDSVLSSIVVSDDSSSSDWPATKTKLSLNGTDRLVCACLDHRIVPSSVLESDSVVLSRFSSSTATSVAPSTASVPEAVSSFCYNKRGKGSITP